MNLFKLSLSYLKRRKLNTLLNVLLLSLGIATITVLLLFSHQVEGNLYKNAEGIDAVVGAKGSPIQLILSSIFHIDAPTGNIDLSDAKELMQHPAVQDAVPLALGDNYKGYRIVGTTRSYIDKYGGELQSGSYWSQEFEVVLGADLVQREGLSLGDEIVSSHGFSGGGHTHDDHNLTVVGILKESGSVIDKLILTGVETMWGIHQVHENEEDHNYQDSSDHDDHHDHAADHEHEHEDHQHHDHESDHSHEDESVADSAGHQHNHEASDNDHENHSSELVSEDSEPPGHSDGHDHISVRGISDQSFLSDQYLDEQITSMLIKYANPLAASQFPRYVNAETNMQAAAPAVEITRLMSLLGVGFDAIEIFAYILIFASVLGIFIALINSMKERRYDLAIMRSLGGSRIKLFLHVVFEGIFVAMAGAVLGIVIGHIAVEGIGMMMAEAQQFNVSGTVFIPEEIWMFVLTLLVGAIAALIPAINAYHTDIAKTLSKT